MSKTKGISDACFMHDITVSNGLKLLRGMIVGKTCLKAFVNPKHCTSLDISIINYDQENEKGSITPSFDNNKSIEKIKKVIGESLTDVLAPKETQHLKELLPKVEEGWNKQVDKKLANLERDICRYEALIENINQLPVESLNIKQITKLQEIESQLSNKKDEKFTLKKISLQPLQGKLQELHCYFDYVFWFIRIRYVMKGGHQETIVYPPENPKYMEWQKLWPAPDFMTWVKEEYKNEEL